MKIASQGLNFFWEPKNSGYTSSLALIISISTVVVSWRVQENG